MKLYSFLSILGLGYSRLLNSSWSTSHHDTHCTDSTSICSVLNENVKHTHVVKSVIDPIRLYNPVTINTDDDLLWGASLTGVFVVNKTDMSLLDFVKKDRLSLHNLYHGAYSFITDTHSFFTGTATTIECFIYKEKQIKKQCDYSVSTIYPEDYIVGLALMNIKNTDYFVYCMKYGQVGVVNKNGYVMSMIELEEEISNSISIDGTNIFVVSDTNMYRLQYLPSQRTIQVVWKTFYNNNYNKYFGRLGIGSGSTPTYMKQSDVVVITDNSLPMNLLFFDGLDGEVVGNVSHPLLLTSEQSVVVYHSSAFIVNNFVEYDEKCPEEEMSKLPERLSLWCAINLAKKPVGVGKFTYMSKGNVNVDWVSSDISCPNGIPVYSECDNNVYCYGWKNEKWGVLGINWLSGTETGFIPVSEHYRYNSMYSALEIGEQGEFISGVTEGITKIGNDM